jgi:hypothetical protein
LVTVNGNDLIRDITRISILDGPVLRRREELTASPRGVSTNLEPPSRSTGDGEDKKEDNHEDNHKDNQDNQNLKVLPELSSLDNPVGSQDVGNTVAQPSRPITRSYKRASLSSPQVTPVQELEE